MKRISFEEARRIRKRISEMEKNIKWYLILIHAPKPRYTISNVSSIDSVFKTSVDREYNGRDAESQARAEANRLNNEADRI